MNAPERKLAEVLLASEIAALQFSAGQEREVDAMIAELKKTVRQMLAEPRFDLVPVAAIDPLMTAVQGAFSSLAADQVLVLKEFLEISTRAAVNGMNKSLGADVFKLPARRLTDDIIIDGTPASNWWSRQAEATQRAFAREVRAGVTSGEGIDEITRRIVGRRGETGILDVSRRQARSLVRSSVLTVSNQGAEDVIQASNDVTNGFIWVSTLDSRSCAYCAPRDLKKYTHAHIPHEHGLSWGFGPGAAHINCRCMRTPWLKSMRELGLDIDDFGPGMRESKNGLVKGDLTFENWIDSQPAGVQKEWFGAGRYEMYRDGKITIKDLTDMRGRELSIAQLRERFG